MDASRLLDMPFDLPRERVGQQVVLERAALHLRIAVELIVLSSLVTNRRALDRVAAALSRLDYADARKLARRANVNYWPDPHVKVELERSSPTSPRFDLQPVTDDYLREDEWGREWGYLSGLLHARNPYLPPPDLAAARRRLLSIQSRLITLLNSHTIHLADEDSKLMVLMHTTETRDVQVMSFVRFDRPVE